MSSPREMFLTANIPSPWISDAARRHSGWIAIDSSGCPVEGWESIERRFVDASDSEVCEVPARGPARGSDFVDLFVKKLDAILSVIS
jgi:hypothetical protein